MKKLLNIIPFLLVVFLLTGCSDETNINNTSNTVSTQTNVLPTQPDRKLDLYGKILSMEGNEFTIQEVDISKDPTFTMTTEEKKAYMAGLSEDQRMALKEEIRNATLDTVTVLIPVGIPVVYKTAQGQDAPSSLGSLEDLTAGSFVSIWYDPSITDKKVVEYVKKSRSN